MKKKIIIKGPVLSRSGYGEQSRFAMRSLQSRPDLFEIYILNIGWGHTGQITDNSEEHQFILDRITQTALHIQNGGTFDMSLQLSLIHI